MNIHRPAWSGEIMLKRIHILLFVVLLAITATVSALGSTEVLYEEWQDKYTFVQYGDDFEIISTIHPKTGNVQIFFAADLGFFKDLNEFKEFFEGFIIGINNSELAALSTISAIYGSAFITSYKESWEAEWKPNVKNVKYTKIKY